MGSKKPLATQQSAAYPSRRAQRYQQKKARARRRIIAGVSSVLLIAGVVLIVVQLKNNDSDAAPFVGSTIEVALGDYTISGNLTAPAGEVRLHAVNNGGAPHDVGLRGGPMSNEMRPGLQTTVDLGTLAPGTYQLYCNVEDHEKRGMVATLVITAPTSAPTATT
jgi:hypothetical protein